MTRRKLYFHKLRMYTLVVDEKGNRQDFLDISQERDILSNILKYMNGNPKFMEFNYKDHSVAIEFIIGVDDFLKNKKGIICGKLSHTKDKHAYQLRTKGTANKEEIATKKNQLFESRSYFLIDTDTMVIAYLNENSAPNIKSLGDWIYSTTKMDPKNSTIWGEVTGLATKDMISNLKKAEYIGTIKYNMEIPESLAAEYTDLSEKDYKSLKNQKFIRLETQLVIKKRGISAFDDADEVESFFNKLKNNKLIKKIKVKMKRTKEDHIREVQLVNNPLNYSIDFDFSSTDTQEYDETISNRIQNEYILHKSEISELYNE